MIAVLEENDATYFKKEMYEPIFGIYIYCDYFLTSYEKRWRKIESKLPIIQRKFRQMKWKKYFKEWIIIKRLSNKLNNDVVSIIISYSGGSYFEYRGCAWLFCSSINCQKESR